MAVGDVWRVSFEGTLLGAEYVNVFHYKAKSVGANPTSFASRIATLLYTPVATQLRDTWVLSAFHARQLAVPAPVVDGSVSVTGGVSTGDTLPPQCALVVSLRTGLAGRSHRGRIYLGGYAEQYQASGQWLASIYTFVQSTLDTMVLELGDSGSSADYTWGVWSRKLGGEDPGPYNLGAGFFPITDAIVRTTVHTQRRRVVGVGR